jgi:hypothetical protein
LKIDAPELAGLTLTIDQPVLAPGGQARVTVASRPLTRGAKAPIRALLTVDPLAKIVPVEISFWPPPVEPPAVQ